MIKKEISAFNDFAQEYASRLGDISLYKNHITTFSELLKESAHIIDLACGPCRISKYISDIRTDVNFDCVDIAPAMISIAQKELPKAHFSVSDIMDYNFDKKFDGVMCSFLFPFLSESNIKKLVERVSKHVNSGAIIYISTMQGTTEGFEKTSFSGDSEVYFIYHNRNFLDSVFIENGFEIISYHEQVFPQDHSDDLCDMIYILKKN